MNISTKEKKSPGEKYIEAVGRRKSAIARVRLFEAPSLKEADIAVNEKKVFDYFPTKKIQLVATEAFSKAKNNKFRVTALVKGGGIVAQAEALRHGLSRALVAYDPELREKLKKSGFLKRDPRAKERRKFGLKKARKAAQWSKR